MLQPSDIITVWNNFIKWYLENARDWNLLREHIAYPMNMSYSVFDQSYGLWGKIWHKHDLMLVFAHHLMNYCSENGIPIHIHLQYNLKPKNFLNIKWFSENIHKALKEINTASVKRKNSVNLDMIITKGYPFEYCLEFKYYHYILYYPDNEVDELQRRINKLSYLRKHKVCSKIGIVLLDDMICRLDKNTCKKIQSLLDKWRKELLILDHYVSYEELAETFKRILQ